MKPRIIEGDLKGHGRQFGIVVSRFNEFITRRLLDGCLKEFGRLGVREKDITIVWVPGSFEIPLVALKLTQKPSIRACICLGAVIRGETLHFDLVARAAADGIASATVKTGKPVIFGVITTNTVKQAYKRSQPRGDNKGRDAARTAVEMANVLTKISGR
jgi:6,7-dimethyl-8-ribityllumazine synthase